MTMHVRALAVAVIFTSLILGSCQSGTGSANRAWASDLAKAVNAACGVLPSIVELLKLFGALGGGTINEAVKIICASATNEKTQLANDVTVTRPASIRRDRRVPVGTVITFPVKGIVINATVTR
jgi:alcohol dehydrogenase YqhD (iron-dependent ADH family)